jgi:hypothetical protein
MKLTTLEGELLFMASGRSGVTTTMSAGSATVNVAVKLCESELNSDMSGFFMSLPPRTPLSSGHRVR